MASYQDHLLQVNSNLQFLAAINQTCNPFTDWQVTACFYTGVHLINAFLAREANAHFNSHERVKDSISPDSTMPATRLDEPTYLAYVKLRNLSRRSRYLCNGDDPNKASEIAHRIAEKHFLRAFICLDRLLDHFYSRYGEAFQVTTIFCSLSKAAPGCKYFKFEPMSTKEA